MIEGPFDWLLKGQALAIFLLGAVIAVLGIVFRAKVMEAVASKAEAVHVADLGRRMDQVEDRLVHMESMLRHMPSADDLRRVEIAMSDQRGEIRAMSATLTAVLEMLKGQGRKMELIDEHLRQQS